MDLFLGRWQETWQSTNLPLLLQKQASRHLLQHLEKVHLKETVTKHTSGSGIVLSGLDEIVKLQVQNLEIFVLGHLHCSAIVIKNNNSMMLRKVLWVRYISRLIGLPRIVAIRGKALGNGAIISRAASLVPAMVSE